MLTCSDVYAIQHLLLRNEYVYSGLLVQENNQSQLVPHTNYEVHACIADQLVLRGVGVLLTREVLQSSYLRSQCYTQYCIEPFNNKPWKIEYFNPILKMDKLKGIILCDCSNSITELNREIMLEKVRKEVVKDDLFFDLIKEYCDLPLIGHDGLIYLTLERGIPPVKEIDSVLYNIYLDDIDAEIEKAQLVFVRFLHVYLFFIPDFCDMDHIYSVINGIFIKNEFLFPVAKFVYKDSNSFTYSNFTISVGSDVKCSVIIDKNGKESW